MGGLPVARPATAQEAAGFETFVWPSSWPNLLHISGLHVGIVIAVLGWPMKRLRGGLGRVGRLAGVAVLILYAGLAGGDAPVVRAVVAGTLGTLAMACGRRGDLTNALAVSLLLVGAWRGDEAARASFLFSFSAVAGIAFLAGRDDARGDDHPSLASGFRVRLVRVLSRSLGVSFGAWLGASIPLLWWTPETVPLGPVFALLFLPLLAILLTLGIISCLTFSPLLAVLAPLVGTTVRAMDVLSRGLDALPGTPGAWPPVAPLALGLALASVAVAVRLRGAQGWPCFLLVLAVVAALAPAAPAAGSLVPVGRGQLFAVVASSATVVLDAGSLDRPHGGALLLRDVLRRHGSDRIDLLVLSHPHWDHINALPALLERLRIGAIAVGPRFEEVPLGHAMASLARRAGVAVVIVCQGDRLRVGALELRVLHPPAVYPELLPYRLNDDSLVVEVLGEGLHILNAGDLQRVGMALMLATRPAARTTAAPTVILPHHGRPALGLEGWLRHLGPAALIASTSRRIAPRTRDALPAVRRFLHTGRDGAVVLPAAEKWRPRPRDHP